VLLRLDWVDEAATRDPADDPRPLRPLETRAPFLDLMIPSLGGASEWAQAIIADPPPPAPTGYGWVDLRAAAAAMSRAVFQQAGRAWQLLEWRRTHRFCGACGTETRTGSYGALACPACGHLHFPRLSPAVIVLVHDGGDRVLLGRGPSLPEGMFSTLAGFVEPGESLEEAVHREIREEADVSLADVRYFGSQPWPFPHSLMVGFVARWTEGTPWPADGELEVVDWFHRNHLPRIPGPASIARSLIDAWLERRLP
jgi:NAD+ diphosphatase